LKNVATKKREVCPQHQIIEYAHAHHTSYTASFI